MTFLGFPAAANENYFWNSHKFVSSSLSGTNGTVGSGSNILWQWNGVNLNQFDSGTFVGNGSPSASLTIRTNTTWPNPRLVLSWSSTFTDGYHLYKITDVDLPSSYAVRFKLFANASSANRSPCIVFAATANTASIHGIVFDINTTNAAIRRIENGITSSVATDDNTNGNLNYQTAAEGVYVEVLCTMREREFSVTPIITIDNFEISAGASSIASAFVPGTSYILSSSWVGLTASTVYIGTRNSTAVASATQTFAFENFEIVKHSFQGPFPRD